MNSPLNANQVRVMAEQMAKYIPLDQLEQWLANKESELAIVQLAVDIRRITQKQS